ncbi:MAG: NAD(P)-dependent oxidoreductase [Thermoguttaceae bacterium]|jgi:GDP-4-dehydro-6-deoxy-D-mannose reductase|nr:NAD(P)-dependent oxidoreductase [Thermoguttaceae bacterium]
MRALITGISGFVGPHLAEHLLECGDTVLGAAPEGQWGETAPQTMRRAVEIVRWDLAAPEEDAGEAFSRIVAFRPEAIYHLAAISVPRQCGQTAPTPLALRVNVEGTRRVVNLAASLRPAPRVLLVSSSHVYAPVTEESPRVHEESPVGPRDAYGMTKLAAERVVREAIARDGVDAVIARSFQHTGPGQGPQMMLPQWIQQFVETTGPVTVYTRDARIDLSDVRDVVRAYRLLIEYGARGEVYNVGSGVVRTSGEVLDVLRSLADPRRAVFESRPGRKQDPIADISRLVHTTGWRAMIPLEKTVADTLAWWRQRPGPTGAGKP